MLGPWWLLGLTKEEELASVCAEHQKACTIILDWQPHPEVLQQQHKLLCGSGAREEWHQLTLQLWGTPCEVNPREQPILKLCLKDQNSLEGNIWPSSPLKTLLWPIQGTSRPLGLHGKIGWKLRQLEFKSWLLHWSALWRNRFLPSLHYQLIIPLDFIHLN